MRKILIVDDEHDIVDIIAKFLEKTGFDVSTAYGGEESINIIASEKIDLAILDMKMPQVDGVDILEAMHNMGKSIPIIILSGSLGVEKSIEALRKLGYNESDIFIKPVDLTVLLKAVKEKLHLSD